MVNITQLRQLIAKYNKDLKVMGVWKMNRAELESAISRKGYEVVEAPNGFDLRPKGAKTHFRKKVHKVKKTKGQLKKDKK